ncbi:MAG: conjugal transfer protein TraN, partial [Thermodesulfobacteriota bacterium]|nr:conjugal transfer protein TraN [Thermodesulfobacteriota bacterium]
VSSTTCPSGYTYNSSQQQCEKAPTCPSGSSYNTSTNRCERAVQWYCSQNGSTYSSQSTCTSSCSQTAQCTQSTPSVSITGIQFGSFTSAIVSGNSLIIRNNWAQPGVTIATINFSVGNLSGGFDGDRHYQIGKIAASGQNLLFYAAIELGGDDESYWSWKYIGKVTFAGITPSGSSSCEWSHRNAYYNYPSGNTIHFGCMGFPSGVISFTSSVVINTCPLGAYACTGSPSTCTKSGSCTSSCPSGYTKSGSLCIANATCSSGGTLNTSVDKCQYAPTYNCDSGFTYDSAIGYCKTNATCDSSGTLDTSFDKCQLSYSHSCPSGYSYNSTYGVCQDSPPCPSGSSYDNSLNQCTIANTWSCPSGMTLTGSICYLSATCSNGSLNTSRDKCEVAYSPTCESGYIYNSSLGVCQKSPTCPSGSSYDNLLNQCTRANTWNCPSGMSLTGSTCYEAVYCPSGGDLNGNTELCEADSTFTCFTSGYSYDSFTNKCISDPVCDYGYYDGLIDLCKLSASGICPETYTYNSDQNKCLLDPPCLSGSSYSTTLNQCSIAAIHDCPTNTVYSSLSRLCEAYPMCEVGVYDPEANTCYEGNNTCPYGTQYPCLEYQGKNQCSAQECVEYGGATETSGDPPGSNDKQDDGQYSEDGNCLGQIYIFNGNDRRCRSGGLAIGFDSCCQDEDYLFGLGQCKQEEMQLAKLKGRGLCHEIGEYCSREIKLGFIKICIEHSKSYCCFNSKLSRIIHEQGRPQMKTDVSNWGSPEGPHCRGFTPEEFQMLDFSRIDLSEWYGDIVPTAQGQVKNNMQQSVQRFYDKVN